MENGLKKSLNLPANVNLFNDRNSTMKTGTLTENACIAPDGNLVDIRIKTMKSIQNSLGENITMETNFTIFVPVEFKEAFNLAKTLLEGDWIQVSGEDRNDFIEKPGGYQKPYHVIYGYELELLKKFKPRSPRK